MRELPVPRAVASTVDTLLDRSVALGFSRIGPAVRRRLPTWPADPAPGALEGRTLAVTGATSGLGLATARGLLDLGAEVRLVVRDAEKGRYVRDHLRSAVPGAQVEVDLCDVGDLDDVRRFAEAFEPSRLDGIVHNAGAMPARRTESAQGHELTMAVHLLGPVLMTELLLPRLDAAARVVLVTSGGMLAQRLRADDPEYLDGDYSPTTAYARSKRAQVELLPELGRRWDRAVCATHPGWADTPGVATSLETFHRLTGPILRTADSGAETTVWLAAQPSEPRFSTGLWHDRRRRPTHLLPTTRSRSGEVERMWAWVAEATGLDR